MNVILLTDIDCMKHPVNNYFIKNNYYEDDYVNRVNPKKLSIMQVGDIVDIPFGNPVKGKIARLKVKSRVWNSNGDLEIYLGISDLYENIPALEKWIQSE